MTTKLSWEDFKKGLTELERPLVDFYEGVLAERPNARVLEIGSGWGIFARSVMEIIGTKLTTIDKRDKLEEFDQRTAGFEDRIERYTDSSESALAALFYAARRFDIVFVDGGHTYELALGDMKRAWEMLEPGGLMMVDDVFHKENWRPDGTGFSYGVARALWTFVDEFLPAGDTFTFGRVGSGGVAIIQKKII